jgi:hypothetical protein
LRPTLPVALSTNTFSAVMFFPLVFINR